MAINGFGSRSMKGLTRFRGTPKLPLQIKPALNTSQCKLAIQYLPMQCSLPFFSCLLIQGAVADYSGHIFSLLILCALAAGNANQERDKRRRAVSDTFKPLASPCHSPAYHLQRHSNYPCWIATPNHT